MQKPIQQLFGDGSDLPLFSGVPLEVTEATAAADPRPPAELEQALAQLRAERAQLVRDMQQLRADAVAVLDEEEQQNAELRAQVAELERMRELRTAQINALLWALGQRSTLEAG